MNNDRKLYLIGNAHLDHVWFWRWQEGFAEIKATFRSVLDRMDEFPEFIFTCASAAYYKWVEENAPEMFEEIKSRVKEGRWVVVGGWWVQPDCNIPSGESFVRHGLYSQRYFKEKFGIMAKVGYNVDSFGHNGMLPQILKKSGMDYYVFQRPNENEKNMPYNLFWWESEDGSRVMAYKLPFGYSHGHDGYEGDTDDLIEEKMKFHATLFLDRKFSAILKLAAKRGVGLMGFYGVGNHGGGPTIKNLELIRKLKKEWGNNKIVHSSPNNYFEEMSAKNSEIPTLKGDLQHHAVGCYSLHSEMKADNRRAEHRVITAEKLVTFSNALLGFEYPNRKIQDAWQNIMLNQFHDIIAGCCIKEAYTDAKEAYGEALNISAVILNASMQKISWSIDTMGDDIIPLDKEVDWRLWEAGERGVPLVVFNPLSWQISVPIQVNKDLKGLTDEKGNPMSIQKVRGMQTNYAEKWDTLFIGNIPAMGYRVYWIFLSNEFGPVEGNSGLAAEITKLENSFICLEFQKHSGYITKIYDKINGVEVLAALGAVPIIIDEYECDTWAHGFFEFRNEIGRFGDAQIRLLENGPLRVRLRVTSKYNLSVLQQDFIIYHDRQEIEVRVKLDWREEHKMLKLSFPVNIVQPKATYEIPYGFIERPVDGSEEPGQRWLDVSGISSDKNEIHYGLTILNDTKYSYDVKENDLRMTVVRSPAYADHFGERDEYCEYVDQGIQEFTYVLVPHKGDWKQSGAVKKANVLNVPPIQIIETYHKGSMPLKYEGVMISSDNIIATVFKRAEEGDGYILRCYETNGIESDAVIEVLILNRKWNVKFGRCEIKTFWIPDNNEMNVVEKNLAYSGQNGHRFRLKNNVSSV